MEQSAFLDAAFPGETALPLPRDPIAQHRGEAKGRIVVPQSLAKDWSPEGKASTFCAASRGSTLYLGTPNCTDLWQYIFNTARLPGTVLDRMAKFPGNDHIAVLHRGRIFRIPIKGIFDLVCLLAIYHYYGYNAQSWEAISMSHYHKGRADIVQVSTPVTAHFCEIADDESLSSSQRFESMIEAAHNRNKTIKDALSGHCYQQTLRAL